MNERLVERVQTLTQPAAKQVWRIESERMGWQSRIFLNDEDFGRFVSHLSFDLPAGGPTTLTLTIPGPYVQIVTDPELHLIVGDRRFRVIEDTPAREDNDGLFGAAERDA